MSKRLFTFKCSHCDTTFDELTEYTNSHICPQCGNNADKVMTCPQIKLEGITGAFPGAYQSWERKRKQKIAQERKISGN